MRIIVGCDHAGFEVKEEIFEALECINCTYEFAGTFSNESCHYPKIAKTVCHKILRKEFNFGILVCGTGTGMAIAANRFLGIRAAMCYDEYSATMARFDNNCNVLCLRAREFDTSKYKTIIEKFFETEFSDKKRHHNRVEMLDVIRDEELLK